MKKIHWKGILLLILAACMIVGLTSVAFADTDVNVDVGGGSMESVGSEGKSVWHDGDDGVRVSVYQLSTRRVLKTVDFSNQKIDVNHYFGYVSKLSYLSGTNLRPQDGKGYTAYTFKNSTIPTIVSPYGDSDVQVIKDYFGDESIIREIAEQVNIPFETLVGGDYKLLLEPIAYFTFNGKVYAATATEAAKLDTITNGALRSTLGNLTSMNLPLAMFLEEDELGISAWGGAKTGYQSDSDIISYLGCAVIRFTDEIVSGGPEITKTSEFPKTGDPLHPVATSEGCSLLNYTKCQNLISFCTIVQKLVIFKSLCYTVPTQGGINHDRHLQIEKARNLFAQVDFFSGYGTRKSSDGYSPLRKIQFAEADGTASKRERYC
jgi:hypothetical protein